MSLLKSTLGWLSRHRRLVLWGLAGATALGATFLIGAALGVFVQRQGLVDRAGAVVSRSLASMDDSDARAFDWTRIETALIPIEAVRVPLGPVAQAGGGGGGLAQVGDNILFMTAVGDLGYLTLSGEIVYLDARVEMGLEALRQTEVYNSDNFIQTYFRSHDLLALPRAGGDWDLYASFHRYREAESCIEVALAHAEMSLVDGRPAIDQSSWRDVFRARPCVDPASLPRMFAGHQSGGRIVQYDDDRIMFSVGDLGLDGGTQPDFLLDGIEDDLSKIFLINRATGISEVFVTGVRNPQGLTMDSTGRIWETEHGKQGGDELNLIRPGVDYGWPHVTLGTDYGRDAPRADWFLNPVQGRHEGYEPPKFAFVPSIGIGNLVEADAGEFPLWAGDLLIGSLREQTLYRVRLEGDEPLYVEPIPMGARLRDLIVLDDGRVAILTDDPQIILVRQAEQDSGATESFAVAGYRAARAHLQSGRPPEPELTPAEEGRRLFAGRCAACHAVRPENEVGPHLVGVVGRPVGSVDGYSYSSAVADAGGTWSESRLRRFMADPASVIPGTVMAPVAVTGDEQARIVDYLKTVQ